MDARAASPSDERTARILRVAANAGMQGFAGECFETAVAINRVLFEGRGTLVAARNKAFWKHDNRFFGHVAVRVDGAHWDADARPKPFEEIGSWAMLDESDSDYQEQAEDAGFEWNEDTASATEAVEFASEAEVLKISGRRHLGKIESILRRAVQSVNASETHSETSQYLPSPEPSDQQQTSGATL